MEQKVLEVNPDATMCPRLLILEDSQRDVELLLSVLREGGLEAKSLVIETREQFCAALENESCDAIIADYRLPTWTGLDALAELRKTGKDIPLLMITGALGEEEAVECIKQGVSDFILKEHLGRLPVALKRALQENKQRAESARAQAALAESEARARQQFAEL